MSESRNKFGLTESQIERLCDARLPVFTQTTSLMKLGYEPAYEFLKDESYIDRGTGKMYGLHFLSPTARSYMPTLNVFMLSARAMVLAGIAVEYMYIYELFNMVRERRKKYVELPEADFIYIVDFHASGGPAYEGENRREMEGLMRQMVEAGIGLCILTSKTLDDCNEWWSDEFLAYMDTHTVRVPVKNTLKKAKR